MDKKFELNQTKIKRGCQSYTKASHQDSKNDLPLIVSLLSTVKPDDTYGLDFFDQIN